jgi:hypothetical protein
MGKIFGVKYPYALSHISDNSQSFLLAKIFMLVTSHTSQRLRMVRKGDLVMVGLILKAYKMNILNRD